jgi:hypothetical protein
MGCMVVAENNSLILTVGAEEPEEEQDCYMFDSESEDEDDDAGEALAHFFYIAYFKPLSKASTIKELQNLFDLIQLWLPKHVFIYNDMLLQCPEAFMRLYSDAYFKESVPEGVAEPEKKIFNYIKKAQEYVKAKQAFDKIEEASHPAKFTSLSARERSLGITWFKRRSAPVKLLTALIVLPLLATLIIPAIVFFRAKWTLQKKSNLAVEACETAKIKLNKVADEIDSESAKNDVKTAVDDVVEKERTENEAKVKAANEANEAKVKAAKVKAANEANEAKAREAAIEIVKSFCDKEFVKGDYVKEKFSQWGLEEGHVSAALQFKLPRLYTLIQALEISCSTKKRDIEKKYAGKVARDQEGLPEKKQYVDFRMKTYMCHNLRLVENSGQQVFDENKIASLFRSVSKQRIEYFDSLRKEEVAAEAVITEQQPGEVAIAAKTTTIDGIKEAQALAAAGREQEAKIKTIDELNDSGCFGSGSGSSSDFYGEELPSNVFVRRPTI